MYNVYIISIYIYNIIYINIQYSIYVNIEHWLLSINIISKYQLLLTTYKYGLPPGNQTFALGNSHWRFKRKNEGYCKWWIFHCHVWLREGQHHCHGGLVVKWPYNGDWFDWFRGVLKWGVPEHGWFRMDNSIGMDEMGVPPSNQTEQRQIPEVSMGKS